MLEDGVGEERWGLAGLRASKEATRMLALSSPGEVGAMGGCRPEEECRLA